MMATSGGWKGISPLPRANRQSPGPVLVPDLGAGVDQVTAPFDYAKWGGQLPDLAKEYADNKPVPHILLQDFLRAEAAFRAAQEFPPANGEAWTQYKHHNENKLGMAKQELFPPGLKEVTEELSSAQFLTWLSGLTGIPGLIADPSLEGGGLHQSTRGGFLNVHTDFSHHHYHEHWRRRINLILYLNPGWRPEWGGDIELWDVKMRSCVAKYPPLFNHALIFTTDERSLHGFPEPLRCPEHESRKSLALYYYVVESEGRIAHRSTNYRARPADGFGGAVLIWLDKKAVDLYSRAKARFRFSDEFASRMLGLLSGKK